MVKNISVSHDYSEAFETQLEVYDLYHLCQHSKRIKKYSNQNQDDNIYFQSGDDKGFEDSDQEEYSNQDENLYQNNEEQIAKMIFNEIKENNQKTANSSWNSEEYSENNVQNNQNQSQHNLFNVIYEDLYGKEKGYEQKKENVNDYSSSVNCNILIDSNTNLMTNNNAYLQVNCNNSYNEHENSYLQQGEDYCQNTNNNCEKQYWG